MSHLVFPPRVDVFSSTLFYSRLVPDGFFVFLNSHL